MSKDDSPELPVAAHAMVADGNGPHYSDGDISEVSTFEFTEKELEDDWRQEDLIKKSDAEEAIQETRRSERQRILDKLDEYISDIESELQRIEETKDKFSDIGNEGARLHHKFQKETLEELRDDLKQEDEEVDAS